MPVRRRRSCEAAACSPRGRGGVIGAKNVIGVPGRNRTARGRAETGRQNVRACGTGHQRTWTLPTM